MVVSYLNTQPKSPGVTRKAEKSVYSRGFIIRPRKRMQPVCRSRIRKPKGLSARKIGLKGNYLALRSGILSFPANRL